MQCYLLKFIFIFNSSYTLHLMSQMHGKYSLKFINICLKINIPGDNIFQLNIKGIKVWCVSFQNYYAFEKNVFLFLLILKNAVFSNTAIYDYTIFDIISSKTKMFPSFLFISLHRCIQQRGRFKGLLKWLI